MQQNHSGSTSLRTVIVEDEAHCRDTLLGLIADECPDLHVVAICDSVAASVSKLREDRIDLVFLDVELPDGTGFDILQRLEEIRFKTIFTTAHAEYAIRAIRFSALDYLMKPVDPAELRAAVDKARCGFHSHETQSHQLRVLHEHLAADGKGLDRIVLPTQDGYSFVELRDVVWCEAQSNYTVFHRVHGPALVSCRTMKEFEEILEAHGFFRIHHSHIVNLRHVVRYVKGKGGYVVMNTGKELEVSVRRKEEFIERIRGNDE
jgi:two-component system, LytTR family, response regulator